MRRIGRIAGASLLGVMALVALGIALVYAISEVRLRAHYEVAVTSPTIPSDAASIERGRHLASAATHCSGCHGADLSGLTLVDAPPFLLIPPNLTRGEGGVGSSYTTEDWVRAIRYGVRPDGTPIQIMPAYNYHALSDADLAAIIAYVQSAAPVDNDPGRTELRLLGRLLMLAGELQLPADRIPPHASRAPVPPAGRTAEYGRYLAVIGNCADCHGANFAGQAAVIPGEPPPPNLTRGGELGTWSEAEFIAAMREGITPSGRPISTAMPWELTGKLSDDELGAIFRYLQSLPPLPSEQD
jgi:mono/diheme cytochrome c family protein